MTEDERQFITAEEAIAVLKDGDYVHNFVQASGMLIGCDYDRAEAVRALRNAHQIEIGGPACRRMNHPIVCWGTEGSYSFFEANMGRFEALRLSKICASQRVD